MLQLAVWNPALVVSGRKSWLAVLSCLLLLDPSAIGVQ